MTGLATLTIGTRFVSFRDDTTRFIYYVMPKPQHSYNSRHFTNFGYQEAVRTKKGVN